MNVRRNLRLADIRGLIRTRLWAQILAAMVLGVAIGLVLSPHTQSALSVSPATATALGDWFRLPGELFLNIIQMVVIPLITTSIILGITSAGDPDFLRRVATRIVPYFVGTSTAAVLIGVMISTLIQPGAFIDVSGLSIQGLDNAVAITNAASAEGPGLAAQIAAIIPSNLSSATLTRNMMQIVIAAIFVGVAMSAIGPAKCEPFTRILQIIQEISMKIVGWAMRLAPLAVLGLIGDFVMRVGFSALIGVSAYIASVLLGLAILLAFYLVIVALIAKRNPLRFAGQVLDAQLLAFSTSSSAATMPLSLRIAEDKLRVKRPIARFIIPLGATVNMDGTALYQVVAALFIAQVFNIHIPPAELALLIVTVVGASIGSPSTPGVGIVILATILQSLGIPPSGVAILLGVDRILDMCRTAINVTGDLTACVVMDRWLTDVNTAPGPSHGIEQQGVVAT